MKVLVIGGGGREHAICWKLAQNPSVDKIYCAPGNGGTAMEQKCFNIAIENKEDMLSLAIDEKIDVTVVGPEALLVEGIVDLFREHGLMIFGPDKESAKLEGSKIFSKDFMKKYGVKTAEYRSFSSYEAALKYLNICEYPVVIKADGLAAGKGVVICENHNDAEETLKKFMIDDVFKGSGKEVVVEEFLQGNEASILSVTDGNVILPFLSSKDHKNIYDGNLGPNTGGMGAIAPNPFFTQKVYKDFEKNILFPTLEGIKKEKMDYRGIIFFGVMITSKGVYLLEYNVRMGDPETQAVLPLMENDFLQVILKSINKDLLGYNITWKNKYSCCIVAASSGYPGGYGTGFEIVSKKLEYSKIFYAGARLNDQNSIVTSGGRVLSVVNVSDSLNKCIENCYKDLEKVTFQGIYYRNDIGKVGEINE